MSSGIRFDENATCDSCGRFGAYCLEGERLCAECYEKRGACCPEFGADDLWPREADEAKQACDPTTRAAEAGPAQAPGPG